MAVEGLHNCKAEFKESTRVSEAFQGRPVWEGDVFVFALTGHPTATLAYAWSSPVEGSDRRKFYAVLHEGPVKSPAGAVRAAIASEYGGQAE